MKLNHSGGVALITVMLILALATVTAVSMASRQNRDIHRSANTLNFEQALQYITGAESFSKQILARHFSKHSSVTLEDDWTREVILPIEGGQMSGQLEELQARFNINSLLDAGGVSNPLQMTRFRNLLATLGLNPDLVEAVVDWIDKDQNPLALNGAEDYEYLRYTPPYRTSDQLMSDVSELLLIKGIDSKMYQTLLPHICVINEVNSNINVNTASAEVITALESKITLDDAKTLVAARNKKSFSSVSDFLKDPIFAGLTIDIKGLSVSSDFFKLTARAKIEKTNLKVISQLQRNTTGTINVIKRSRSVL